MNSKLALQRAEQKQAKENKKPKAVKKKSRQRLKIDGDAETELSIHQKQNRVSGAKKSVQSQQQLTFGGNNRAAAPGGR